MPAESFLGILARRLVVPIMLGQRFLPAVLTCFELVQPRFGEGLLEDAR